MIDIDKVLKSLGKPNSHTGWISPAGDVFSGVMYSHFPLLKDLPRFKLLVSAYDIAKENEGMDSQSFVDQHEDGEHIGWHAYWSEWDDITEVLRSLILDVAYSDGYIRYFADSWRKKLNIEGTRDAINKNMAGLKRLSKSIGYELELSIIDNHKHNYNANRIKYLNDHELEALNTLDSSVPGFLAQFNKLKDKIYLAK